MKLKKLTTLFLTLISLSSYPKSLADLPPNLKPVAPSEDTVICLDRAEALASLDAAEEDQSCKVLIKKTSGPSLTEDIVFGAAGLLLGFLVGKSL